MTEVKKTTGVYAIFLEGTPYVWPGSSANIEQRFIGHRNTWVWPNLAQYVVIREMPNSSRRDRERTEMALFRLLRYRGYITICKSPKEHVRDAGIANISNIREIGKSIQAKHRELGLNAFGETSSQTSMRISGEKHPMYGKRGKDNPNFGKKHTEETLRKLSSIRLKIPSPGMTGKHHSGVTRQKQSEKMVGNKNGKKQ